MHANGANNFSPRSSVPWSPDRGATTPKPRMSPEGNASREFTEQGLLCPVQSCRLTTHMSYQTVFTLPYHDKYQQNTTRQGLAFDFGDN
jgi:hypothetical protein